MKKLFLISLFTSVLFGAEGYQATYSKEQIMEDFKKGDVGKYRADTMATFSREELVKRGVILPETKLSSNDTTFSCGSFVNSDVYTATVYRMDPKTGAAVCMYALKDNLYNPLGLFSVSFPKIAEQFKLDQAAAKAENASVMDFLDNRYKTLIERKDAVAQTQSVHGGEFLTIPQMLLSANLTDTDIINIDGTKASGKLQLQDQYTATIYSDEVTSIDNAELIKNNAASLFNIYGGLSNLAVELMLYLAVVIGVVSGGGILLNRLSKATDKEEQTEKFAKVSWGFGLLLGILLLLPYNANDATDSTNTVMKTHIHDFEKVGYYFGDEIANQMSKIMIDNTLTEIIANAGIANSDQVVNSYAMMKQYEKLEQYATNLQTECSNMYDSSNMLNVDKVSIYSSNGNTIYPSSELWGYALSWSQSGGKDYYNLAPEGLRLDGGTNDTYAKYAFSACAGIDHLVFNYKNKKKDYQVAYEKSTFRYDINAEQKLEVLENLIEFQYSLYRDWGYLSVLALGVTKLQSDVISNLYAEENNHIKRLNDEIGGGSMFNIALHKFVSSLPYGLLPGAQSVYTYVEGKAHILGGAAGMAGGAAVSDVSEGWLDQFVGGIVGGVVGAASSYVASKPIAYSFTVIYVLALLSVMPVLAILIFGIARFIIIFAKILIFHFAGLVLLPVLFVNKNTTLMKNFGKKLLVTMLEIPLFVLAIWLAVTAQAMLQTIANTFNKNIIAGLVKNNAISSGTTAKVVGAPDIINNASENMNLLVIYCVDGVSSVAVSIFSIVLIYGIINKMHTAFIEAIDLQGDKVMDSLTDQFVGESKNFGGRL